MASAVWWALSTLPTTREFWAGLAATLIGVLLAFELERWRDRRHSREQYARALNAVRYETAQLHGICLQALAALPRGLSSYEIDAPALRGFVSSPALQEHGSHGLTIVLIGLLSSVGAARNSLEHFRRQVRIGGTEILAVHLAPLSKHDEPQGGHRERANAPRPRAPAAQARGPRVRARPAGHSGVPRRDRGLASSSTSGAAPVKMYQWPSSQASLNFHGSSKGWQSVSKGTIQRKLLPMGSRSSVSPSPTRTSSGRIFRFSGDTAPSSLEGADGVIIPQGIFEHFEWETGLRPSARCSIPRQPGLRLFGMSSEPSSSATELRRLPFTFLSAAILEC